MQHDHVLKKLKFDLLTLSPRGRGVGGGLREENICYHVAAYLIPFNLICNMTFWKRWKLTFWPYPLGKGMGFWGQNICNNVAAFVIPFNLIYNMTKFFKNLNFDLVTPTHDSERGLWAKYLLSCCCNSGSI